MKYRAEIDGLRALAVVPVILFHAGFEVFRGGFIGVDIFFVISGYLITTILVEDIENNRFSIISFYERRARRILPALLFVILVCILFAWMWMLPSQMKDFSRSLVAVILFISNVLFWRESGYFAAAADEKPLLHTWSLAVEEQYYLLFPIFLFLAWRFGRNKVFWMIIIFAIISLILSEWGWRNEPTANFYLAPTRAWELLSGSITAFIVHKRGVQSSNLLSLLGLTAIIFSIFAFSETTPFPSVYSLVPVIAVVLLILFAGKETFVAKLLSTKIFVWGGLISYSAYLWHQPLFAFARIKEFGEPELGLMLFLIFACIFLGFFSWKFVEQPFRDQKKVSKYQLFLSLTTISSLIILFGLYTNYNKGFGSRISMSLNNKFIKAIVNEWHFSNYPEPQLLVKNNTGYHVFGAADKKKDIVLLVGDSHSYQYWNAFNKLLESEPEQFDKKMLMVKSADILGLNQLVLPENTKTVVLSYFWSLELNNSSVNTYIRCCGNGPGGVAGAKNVPLSKSELDSYYFIFQKSLKKLLSQGLKVYIVLDNPFGEELNPKSLVDINLGFGVSIELTNFALKELDREEAITRTEPARSRLLDIAKNLGVEIIDPINYLCNQVHCPKYSEKGYLLYKDYDHLSLEAIKNNTSYIYKILK